MLSSLTVNDGSLADCVHVFLVLGYGRSPVDFFEAVGSGVSGTRGGIGGEGARWEGSTGSYTKGE